MNLEQTDKELFLFKQSATELTVDDVIKKAKIDLSKFTIAKVKAQHYEVGMKVEGTDAKGRKYTRGTAIQPLWIVSVVCIPKTGPTPEEFKQTLKKELTKPHKFPSVKHTKPANGLLFVPSIPDFHLGKIGYFQANISYHHVLDYFINIAQDYPISRICFPIGNDFLNIDHNNATTKGTPQLSTGWTEAYLKGRQILTEAILKLRQIAPVDVLVVPGNHDEEKMFCMGDALECYFHKDKAVTVDNNPIKQKAYTFGNVFIGYEHGHKSKYEHLPQDYAIMFPHKWANATWREIHLGHQHRAKEDLYRTKEESNKMTTVRKIPSLSPIDEWHHDNKYFAPRAAEAFLFTKSSRFAIFNYA